jgi:hypothetical protein
LHIPRRLHTNKTAAWDWTIAAALSPLLRPVESKWAEASAFEEFAESPEAGTSGFRAAMSGSSATRDVLQRSQVPKVDA